MKIRTANGADFAAGGDGEPTFRCCCCCTVMLGEAGGANRAIATYSDDGSPAATMYGVIRKPRLYERACIYRGPSHADGDPRAEKIGSASTWLSSCVPGQALLASRCADLLLWASMHGMVNHTPGEQRVCLRTRAVARRDSHPKAGHVTSEPAGIYRQSDQRSLSRRG